MSRFTGEVGSLAFGMDTAGELMSYGQSRRSPPAVMQTLWISVFCGQVVQTWFFYVTRRPSGTWDFLMNFIVPVPLIFLLSGLDFTTPFVRSLTHSFAFDLSQSSLSGPFSSSSRDSCLPVSGGVTSAAM